MACNPNRSQCTVESVFAAVANPNCGQLLDPENLQAEQLLYDMTFKDLINNFGIPIDYYIHTYNLSSADNLYGEHPTSIFYGPVSIMMYLELTENAINLSRFGFASDDELTGYVHIKTFEDAMSARNYYILDSNGEIIYFCDYSSLSSLITETTQQSINTEVSDIDIVVEEAELICEPAIGSENYEVFANYINNGQSVEPKSGDLIKVWPLGCDRPNGRGAKIFEITERTDQDVSSINPILGHYVYRLKAKRFEYSFEPGAPQEPQNQQVFEDTFSGKLSSNIPGETPSAPKSYPTNVNDDSKTKVLDMSVNNTDIYGTYY